MRHVIFSLNEYVMLCYVTLPCSYSQCWAHIRTTHREYLAVFIAVQILVRIDSVVLIKYAGMKMPIYAP